MVRYIYLLFELGILAVILYFVVGYIYQLSVKDDQDFEKTDPFSVMLKWPFYMIAKSKRRH